MSLRKWLSLHSGETTQNPYFRPSPTWFPTIFTSSIIKPLNTLALGILLTLSRILASCHQMSPTQRGPPKQSIECCLPLPTLRHYHRTFCEWPQRACTWIYSIYPFITCLPVLPVPLPAQHIGQCPEPSWPELAAPSASELPWTTLCLGVWRWSRIFTSIQVLWHRMTIKTAKIIATLYWAPA